ncbi:transposon TX1 [Tanacetum coccineum]
MKTIKRLTIEEFPHQEKREAPEFISVSWNSWWLRTRDYDQLLRKFKKVVESCCVNLISFDRITSFFVDDELKDNRVTTKQETEKSGNNIRIQDGNFAWDPKSTTPTLRNVNLEVKCGQKVAVCGTMYEKAIKACALDTDIEAFKHRDLTEIGQRGLNMSGGQKQRIQLARAVYIDADIYLLDNHLCYDFVNLSFSQQNLTQTKKVREGRERFQSRDGEIMRERHIGNRGEYNGKRLGTNYIGGKRNSAVSFMFFNFPNDLGMGNLWMLFQKYGTFFDKYMVQKRLRNGQRYGFVRLKLVEDVGLLIRRVREIKIGELTLKVFLAYDRKNPGDDRKMEIRSEENKYERGGEEKKKECKNQDDKLNPKKVYEEIRRIEVNLELFNRCLIGEVTSLRYLTKISDLCHEQGLSKVEVKLLGGLEIMLVFDTPAETAGNILSCIDHVLISLGYWLYMEESLGQVGQSKYVGGKVYVFSYQL